MEQHVPPTITTSLSELSNVSLYITLYIYTYYMYWRTDSVETLNSLGNFQNSTSIYSKKTTASLSVEVLDSCFFKGKSPCSW